MRARKANKLQWHPHHAVRWGCMWLCISLLMCIIMVCELARHAAPPP